MFTEEQLKEEDEEEEALTGKDEEERRIAEMGRPMLGDHVKLEVIIEESYEFKVRQGADKMLISRAEMAEESVKIKKTLLFQAQCTVSTSL